MKNAEASRTPWGDANGTCVSQLEWKNAEASCTDWGDANGTYGSAGCVERMPHITHMFFYHLLPRLILFLSSQGSIDITPTFCIDSSDVNNHTFQFDVLKTMLHYHHPPSMTFIIKGITNITFCHSQTSRHILRSNLVQPLHIHNLWGLTYILVNQWN